MQQLKLSSTTGRIFRSRSCAPFGLSRRTVRQFSDFAFDFGSIERMVSEARECPIKKPKKSSKSTVPRNSFSSGATVKDTDMRVSSATYESVQDLLLECCPLHCSSAANVKRQRATVLCAGEKKTYIQSTTWRERVRKVCMVPAVVESFAEKFVSTASTPDTHICLLRSIWFDSIGDGTSHGSNEQFAIRQNDSTCSAAGNLGSSQDRHGGTDSCSTTDLCRIYAVPFTNVILTHLLKDGGSCLQLEFSDSQVAELHTIAVKVRCEVAHWKEIGSEDSYNDFPQFSHRISYFSYFNTPPARVQTSFEQHGSFDDCRRRPDSRPSYLAPPAAQKGPEFVRSSVFQHYQVRDLIKTFEVQLCPALRRTVTERVFSWGPLTAFSEPPHSGDEVDGMTDLKHTSFIWFSETLNRLRLSLIDYLTSGPTVTLQSSLCENALQMLQNSLRLQCGLPNAKILIGRKELSVDDLVLIAEIYSSASPKFQSGAKGKSFAPIAPWLDADREQNELLALAIWCHILKRGIVREFRFFHLERVLSHLNRVDEVYSLSIQNKRALHLTEIRAEEFLRSAWEPFYSHIANVVAEMISLLVKRDYIVLDGSGQGMASCLTSSDVGWNPSEKERARSICEAQRCEKGKKPVSWDVNPSASTSFSGTESVKFFEQSQHPELLRPTVPLRDVDSLIALCSTLKSERLLYSFSRFFKKH